MDLFPLVVDRQLALRRVSEENVEDDVDKGNWLTAEGDGMVSFGGLEPLKPLADKEGALGEFGPGAEVICFLFEAFVDPNFPEVVAGGDFFNFLSGKGLLRILESG